MNDEIFNTLSEKEIMILSEVILETLDAYDNYEKEEKIRYE